MGNGWTPTPAVSYANYTPWANTTTVQPVNQGPIANGFNGGYGANGNTGINGFPNQSNYGSRGPSIFNGGYGANGNSYQQSSTQNTQNNNGNNRASSSNSKPPLTGADKRDKEDLDAVRNQMFEMLKDGELNNPFFGANEKHVLAMLMKRADEMEKKLEASTGRNFSYRDELLTMLPANARANLGGELGRYGLDSASIRKDAADFAALNPTAGGQSSQQTSQVSSAGDAPKPWDATDRRDKEDLMAIRHQIFERLKDGELNHRLFGENEKFAVAALMARADQMEKKLEASTGVDSNYRRDLADMLSADARNSLGGDLARLGLDSTSIREDAARFAASNSTAAARSSATGTASAGQSAAETTNYFKAMEAAHFATGDERVKRLAEANDALAKLTDDFGKTTLDKDIAKRYMTDSGLNDQQIELMATKSPNKQFLLNSTAQGNERRNPEATGVSLDAINASLLAARAPKVQATPAVAVVTPAPALETPVVAVTTPTLDTSLASTAAQMGFSGTVVSADPVASKAPGEAALELMVAKEAKPIVTQLKNTPNAALDEMLANGGFKTAIRYAVAERKEANVQSGGSKPVETTVGRNS